MSIAECAFCGRERRVKDRVDGAARCATCLKRDPATWRECHTCHRARPVNARTPQGEPLCGTCYSRHHAPRHRCEQCGRLATAMVRGQDRGGTGQTLCAHCFRHPQRPCGGCGRTRRVAVRATTTSPDLCPTCHQAPVLTCHQCGTHDLCRTTGPGRTPLCFRCQLTTRLDDLLTPPDATAVPDRLRPLRDAIATITHPRTALGWLQRSPAARLLRRIATGELPLTHATLDTAAPATVTSVEHLRRLLVAADALPERDDMLARLHAHADTTVTTLDHPADQALLRTYLTWQLLRRIHARAEHAPLSPAAAYRARAQITAAARLLTALRDAGLDLPHAAQPQLDTALAGIPDPGAVSIFLNWARRQRLTTLTGPAWPGTQLPRDFLDHQQRWATSRRLLGDTTIPTADRVAGLLVLLYGQRASTISQLTVDDVTPAPDGTVALSLGRDRLLIPPPLAELITRLPDQRPRGIAANLTDHRWLFPGRRPDRAALPGTLMRRLARHHIPLRLSRNAALLHLAAELPPVVIADLLGISPTTANRWSDAAGGRWMNYAAHRHSASSNINSLPV